MLRVGVLLDSTESEAWIAEILRRLQTSDFARLELVLFTSSQHQERSSNNFNSSLFRLYESWDYRRNRCDSDPLAPADLSEFLGGITKLSPDDLAGPPSGLNLDVLLSLARRWPSADLRECARYGVWSLDVGGNPSYLPGPSCFWPMYLLAPTTNCTLLMHSREMANAPVAYNSPSATEPWSLYANRRMTYWKAAEIALRCLRELDSHGAKFIRSLPTHRAQSSTVGADTQPQNIQMLAFGARFFPRWLQARMAGLSAWPKNKWFIVLRRRSPERRFDDPAGYTVVPCPRDRFYADPFLFEKDGRTFLFFEDFRYSKGRACISCSEVLTDNSITDPVEVLNPPFHLSYPFVFEDEGNIYMIPESRSSRNVVLYRAAAFPRTWIPDAVLMEDIHAVDTTIHKANGKYWMFTSVSDGRYSNSDELSLFFADALRGPWKPHPKNPLVSDVRFARPAGALFYHDGRLIRPSQNCSKVYGYGLVFSEIIKLTETEYEERPIAELYPESVRGNRRNHTYNRADGYEVIDRFLSVKVI